MHIVILGAGYAGLRTALNLDRLLRERGMDDTVTLVDQNSYHQLIQKIHVTATSRSHSPEAIYSLGRILDSRQITFVQGQVRSIALVEREVLLEDGRDLPYDRLVIALGSETAYYNVPGAREHSLPLRTYAEATHLRDHLIDQFTTAATLSDPKQQRIMLTTAIVGGGCTGCELAGELASWVGSLSKETGAPRSEVRIALLDRNKLLLKQFGPWASREAERVFDLHGVSVYLNTAIESVEPNTLQVSGERVLRAGTIIWVAGICAPRIIADAGLPVNGAGKAIVDRYLHVSGHDTIFALGDCAAVAAGTDGSMLPSTASYAIRQGEYLAETIFAEMVGNVTRSYESLKLGELVSLGPDNGVGNPLGMPILGHPVLVLKKGIEQYYRASITAL
ncbi:MAG: NAD(P)/FAD-dependent oxidoreductase [Chloroflexales bacterium]|jgi:NADH:ubiquinone reductase (H+-translocating)